MKNTDNIRKLAIKLERVEIVFKTLTTTLDGAIIRGSNEYSIRIVIVLHRNMWGYFNRDMLTRVHPVSPGIHELF